MGGDVIRVLVGEFDEVPGPEVAVFAGAWSAYAILVLRWEGRGLACVRRIPLGLPTAGEALGGPTLVVGSRWQREGLHPMLHLLGEERFHATFRVPGVYLCRLDREAGSELEPLEAGAWSDGDDGAYWACLLRGPARRYLWVAGRMNGFPDRPAVEGEARPSGSLWVEDEGGSWRRFARVSLALRRPFHGFGEQFLAGTHSLDLDGDGDDELVFAEGNALRVRGLPGAAGPPSTRSEGTVVEDRLGAGVRHTLDALDAGRDAERVGLWDEALETYTRLLLGSDSAAELLAAGVGRLRCLGALARHEELAREAAELVRAWPGREQDLVPPCVEALCAAREWELAGKVLDLQVAAPGLDPEGRRVAWQRANELRALARPGRRIALVGAEAGALDWMLSSPFAATREADGIVFAGATGAGIFCAVPVAVAWEGVELRGDLEPERLDWAVGMAVALADAPPWEGTPASRFQLGYGASGDTQYPQRTVSCDTAGAQEGASERLLFRTGALPGRLVWSLQRVPHPSRLVARLHERGHDPVERVLAGGGPGRREAWVVLGGSGWHAAGYWARLRCRTLELVTRRADDGVRSCAPVSALEHLLLANGRWAFGREAEAEPLYDTAIRLAEDEWEADARHVAEGLPSRWAAASPESPARWCAVDGRFARGLLRWERGREAEGVEDLRRAWELSEERCLRLVVLHAPILAERAGACAALGRFWRAREGEPEGEALLRAAARTWRRLGGVDLALQAFMGPRGPRAERFLEVTAVDPGGACAGTGLAPGDELAEIDGKRVRSMFDWNEARIAAEKRGLERVKAAFRRGGSRTELELAPDLRGLRLEEKVRLVR